MKLKTKILFLTLVMPILVFGQKKFNGPPMFMDVNAIKMDLKKVNGEGQFTTQYSWMLTGSTSQIDEIFCYPQDQWYSNMLYQIFNPIAPDDDGFINQLGEKKIIPTPYTSPGKNIYSWEKRRYAPPAVYVDEIRQNQEYPWETDPNLKADMVAVWEDILPFWGFRTKVELYGFANQNHNNYLIWKATYKFTGETKTPIENPDENDFFPDQSVRLWWPLSFSFGPSKAGEYYSRGSFAFEGEDDLDSWFAGKLSLPNNDLRDSLKIAYYYDYKTPGVQKYKNGSFDDSGDPDKITGHLMAPQIPGFALLHAAKNSFDPSKDNTDQPYSMPHGTITGDLWGRRDPGLRDTYIGDDARGKFPLDPITEGFISAGTSQKGPMRFVTIGPYDLEKQGENCDSLCAVYALGVGSIDWNRADSVGKAWLAGEITDEEKNAAVLTGKDSLLQAFDRANWVWHRGFDIPDPPPSPDIAVTSDADRVIVKWSYPDPAYFLDPDAKVDDWAGWRVYRKTGANMVGAPGDKFSGAIWESIYETSDRNETEFIDYDVTRGVAYYYAVTAIDDGSQNTNGLFPGQALESSRYANRTSIPAVPFKKGLDVSDEVVVVPNPATVTAGALGFPGEENQIMFANLPYKCEIRIYTETGDFIYKADHIGNDQELWFQKTDDNQYVSPGIYILAVTRAENIEGKKLADQFTKFILVR
ncbi:MAG: hypothetical protein JXQ65_06560 [Candidatus Marinimicrobia bacterium]|nr:hypothetical protein [Candidatus Neomarinimicrobiota bacterium]